MKKSEPVNEKELVEFANKILNHYNIGRHTKKHTCPKPTAIDIVNHVMDRPIVWVDKSKMSKAQRIHYSNLAKNLLNNELFTALCGMTKEQNGKDTSGLLAKNIIETIARHSKNHEETDRLRHTINGVELVREYVQSFIFEESKVTMDDINAPL